MAVSILYSSNMFRVSVSNSEVFLETFSKGILLEELNMILESLSDVAITNKDNIRTAVFKAPHPPIKIGKIKPRIDVQISEDFLKAYVVFNLPEKELDISYRKKIIMETTQELKKNGIVTGLKLEFLAGQIKNNVPYLAAEGIQPIPGKNAVIKMYEIKEPELVIDESGKADYYEVKLINKVTAGAWLGEKISPTAGVNGVTVKNTPIPAPKGIDEPLLYDPASVLEICQANLTTLFAKFDGAVKYEDGKIKVQNHLQIDGDVDFSTGNIDFPGYVTISGTITDGFSVKAKNDIEILGSMGLGNVKEIISTEGNIYIKGGIIAKNIVNIEAAGNVYVKFCNNAKITCGGSLHIGYYSESSILEAQEVIIDSESGSIIGGSVASKYKVVTANLGSEAETKTTIFLRSFNRDELMDEINKLDKYIKEQEDAIDRLKKSIQQLEVKAASDTSLSKLITAKKSDLMIAKSGIVQLKKKLVQLKYYLRTKGNGEINIKKNLYPNCKICLNKHIIEVTKPVKTVTYVLQDDEVKEYI